MSSSNNLHFEHNNRICKIILPDQVGLNNIIQIQGRIDLELESYKPEKVTVDLSKLTYLSSTTITLLMRLRDRVINTGGGFYLFNVSDICRERLELIHLDKIFAICEDASDISALSENTSE
jgi:anti-anti-sigma factor